VLAIRRLGSGEIKMSKRIRKIVIKEHFSTRGGTGSTVGWIAGIVAVGAAIWAVSDYAKWRSLGPGGLPANVRGWLTMTRFRLMARGGLDMRPLVNALEASKDLRAWSDPRPRFGKRPTVSPYPVPHRQLDQLPAEVTRRELTRLFDRAVLQHADEVEYALSHFEKRHPAIKLKIPDEMAVARSHGEIAHIHPSDNSMHMILSPGDAIAAIEMGWAERHGLAGIAAGLPVTYVMVYAPRDECDLAVVAELLEAAITHAKQP
jgi:Family of unknown function (DUF5519)